MGFLHGLMRVRPAPAAAVRALARFLVSSVGCAAIALSATGQPVHADTPGDLLALLPPSAEVQLTTSGDFTGSGQEIWAVHYTLPDDQYSTTDAHVLFAIAGGDGWSPLGDASISQAYGSSVQVVTVGGLPSVALTAYVGAHSSELLVERWNGQGFVSVFDGISSSSIGVQDLDHDGSAEVVKQSSLYCGSYAGSPSGLEIQRWDGTQFVEATGAFPSMLADTERKVRAAWYEAHHNNAQHQWDAAATQCLDQARDTLSSQSGRWSQVSGIASVDAAGSVAYTPAPQYPADNRLFKIVAPNTLRVSTTQGRTWEDLGNFGTAKKCGVSPTLSLSPTFATDQTMLILDKDPLCYMPGRSGSFGAISNDGGHTWSAIGPVENRAPTPADYSLHNTATVLFSPTFATDQHLWFANVGTLAMSANAGRDWRVLSLPGAKLQLTQFAATGSAAGSSSTWLLSANDPTREPATRYFRSIDGGATWQEITDAFRDPASLAVTSVRFVTGADPAQVYATTRGATWYSGDSGATWKKVSDVTVSAVTNDGCAVALFPVEVGLQCGDAKLTLSYKAPQTNELDRLWSVASFGDRGTVLVETGNGLAEYRFRP